MSTLNWVREAECPGTVSSLVALSPISLTYIFCRKPRFSLRSCRAYSHRTTKPLWHYPSEEVRLERSPLSLDPCEALQWQIKEFVVLQVCWLHCRTACSPAFLVADSCPDSAGDNRYKIKGSPGPGLVLNPGQESPLVGSIPLLSTEIKSWLG